ncbi:MAG TPA: hypothetical protein VK766_08545 [Cytophagaceae bacterium]|nr:hypothetical protein [Cytophagaceae bacterium]
MKKIILLTFTIFFYSALTVYPQNKKLVSGISKVICNCLEKYNDLQSQKEIEAAMENCIMKSSMKNLDAVKKEMGIDMTQGEEAGRQFGEIISYELIKKCQIFLKYIMMVSTDDATPKDSTIGYEESSFQSPDIVPYEKFSTDTMTTTPQACLSIRNAKYVYVTDNPDKTDYFILHDKKCVEYHDNGKYISHYNIKWKSDCTYESVFIESSNPEINNLLSKGDKINYQILGIYSNIVYINLDYKGFSKTFKMFVQKQ